MAASGDEENISVNDSDRENFRRRGRGPASKRGGGHDNGLQQKKPDEHEFAIISERCNNRRKERSPAGSNRGDCSGERERGEQEFARGGESIVNGRNERSPIGKGSQLTEREPKSESAKVWEWEDNGRMRVRSPVSRRSGRDRERSERENGRGFERRDKWRGDRRPGSRRGGRKERDHRYARGSDRGGNGTRERSDGSKRVDSRDIGCGQNDFGRGGSRRGGERRREGSPVSRVINSSVKDNRGDYEFAGADFERVGASRTDGSNAASVEGERGDRGRNSDVGLPQGSVRRRITRNSLSPRELDLSYAIKREYDVREVEEERRRRFVSHITLTESIREETSDAGNVQWKSADEEGSDEGDSKETGEEKVYVLRKTATGDNRDATSDGGGGENWEEHVRGAQRLGIENSDSGDESEQGEGRHDERKARKRKVRREKEKKEHDKRRRKHGVRSKGKKRKFRGRETSPDEASSESESPSSSNGEVSESEDEEEREKARKQRWKRRRKEKERELEREMKRKMKKKLREFKEKKQRTELKKKEKEMRSKKPITTSWGKYGILKDIDMWNKKPEFGAWLAEVKKVNIETLANWEEKQMFKEYMEDYNTATFPSKKYYNLDVYHRRKVAKEMRKGIAQAFNVERTDFNDEDERRLELQQEREKQKEAEVEALMRKMQSGMAQDMREQAQLREEMQYQFRLGNTEAAQAIQRRLDPDAEKFTK